MKSLTASVSGDITKDALSRSEVNACEVSGLRSKDNSFLGVQ